MKLNPDAVEAAKELRMPDLKVSSRGRYREDTSVFLLEETDFDKAIAILHDLNKKAKVKEWLLAKEAFVEGNYDGSVDDFMRLLTNDACGRADTFTRNNIINKINKVLQSRRGFSGLWRVCLLNPISSCQEAHERLENAQGWVASAEERLTIVRDFISNNDVEKVTEEQLEELKEQIGAVEQKGSRY